MIGYVMVTRDGGGFGESLIGAIIFSVSCKRMIKKNNYVFNWLGLQYYSYIMGREYLIWEQ
jgi:hypothetical protein